MSERYDNKEKTPISHVRYLNKDHNALAPGRYDVLISQALKGTSPDKNFEDRFEERRSFYIGTERFAIDADSIQEIYPPRNSLDVPDSGLPHLVLTQSTLPWERQAVPGDPINPWLALLLFHEGEFSGTSQVIPAIELNDGPGNFKLPFEDDDSDGNTKKHVNVLDVPRRLLEKALPSVTDLRYTAHVREASDSEVSISRQAYLVSNRLPKPGLNTVYLVSLEGRYTDAGFDFNGAAPDDLIRLVKMYSWQFTALKNSNDNLEHLLRQINEQEDGEDVTDGEANTALVANLLKKGYCPIGHELRQGGKVISWYHGPLSRGFRTDEHDSPVKSGDGLLGILEGTGMLDVSYTLAWELGRLMALRNGSFSKEIYQWKRRYARAVHQDRQMKDPVHLKRASKDPATLSMPDVVKTWLDGLRHLEGVPFPYLIPDERLLRENTIRFFKLDPWWIRSLIQGATSIGSVASSHLEFDIQLFRREAVLNETPVSGLIMRSEVVAGWPRLQIEGYSDSRVLRNLRRVKLSDQILLCLFEGELSRVDVFQHAAYGHITVNMEEAYGSGFIDDHNRISLVSWEGEAQTSEYLEFGSVQGMSFRKAGYPEMIDPDIPVKDPNI